MLILLPLPCMLIPRASTAYKFHSDQEADWQMIYNLALRCKGRQEFIQMLKIDGYLVSAHPGSGSLQAAAGETEIEAAFRKDVAAPDASASRPGGLSAGDGAAGSRGGGGKKSRRVDYGNTDVEEQGPRDGRMEDEVEDEDEEQGADGRSRIAKPRDSGGFRSDTGAGVDGGKAETSLPEVAEDGGPPPLSSRLAHKYAINNTIIVTWANYALWDFVKSWAHHVQRLGELFRGVVAWRAGCLLTRAGHSRESSQ